MKIFQIDRFLIFIKASIFIQIIFNNQFVKSQKVTLYEHYDKEGASLKLNSLKKCTQLTNRWQNRASSVDSHGSCVVLYENSDCTGRYMRLRPGTLTFVPNLKKIKFNDNISSVKPCQVQNVLRPGRYAIQNEEDKKYLTARHLVIGYTSVDTEKWRQKISQQWDVTTNLDGTYWLIPRIHFSKNPLTYDMRRHSAKNEYPETGMFKDREYWILRNIKGNTFMIKNDDSKKCLLLDYNGEIEQDDCDKGSTNQHWMFHQLFN